MKPNSKRILIRTDLAQKETITFGTLKLYIPNRADLNENKRIGNPVLAEVVSVGEGVEGVSNGDILLLQHNSLINDAYLLERDGDIALLVIPADKEIKGKIGKDGKFIPLFGNVHIERISETPASSIIITPDAYKTTDSNKVKILAVANDVKGLEPGETAIIYQYSDYEIAYNDGAEERSVITCNSKEIVAVERLV